MLKLLLIPVILYVAVAAAAYFAQTSLLFPARLVQQAPLPPGAERLVLATPDGERLEGAHIPPIQAAGGEAPLILGFGGNAWNAYDVAAYLHELYPEADVVAFHFRGYAPSSGRPGAEALLRDAPLVHDFVARKFPSRPIVAVGFSIGSGVAARLAARRPLAGLILVTPFESLAEVARGHYPWLPVKLLFRHEMNPAEDLRGSALPVAIVAAERDTLIPPPRTDALRRQVPNLVFDRTVPGAGHNDIYQHPAFRAAMGEALGRILAAR